MDPKLYKDISTHKRDALTSIQNDNRLKDKVTMFQKNTILHVAAMSGNFDCVKEIARRHRTLLTATNTKGDTALHVAARLGDLGIVRFLTECHIDEAEGQLVSLEMKNNEKNTALHEAVLGHNYEVVDYLIQNAPTLANCENQKNESALFLAVERGFYRIANRIVSSGPYSVGGRNGMNVMQAASVLSQNGNNSSTATSALR